MNNIINMKMKFVSQSNPILSKPSQSLHNHHSVIDHMELIPSAHRGPGLDTQAKWGSDGLHQSFPEEF